MAAVFWDAHDIIFIDYLVKGKTINSVYYMALLERLKAEIEKKNGSINVSHLKETMLTSKEEFCQKDVVLIC